MTPMRLCFVGWADHVHLERWAGHFAKLGHEVSIVSMSGTGNYPPGVRQYTLTPGAGTRRRRLQLRWLLWRIRPQLVHVHWAHFAPDARAVWSGPLAVTAWGSDIYLRRNFSDEAWHATLHALRTADLVTCDSDDLATQILGQFRSSSPPRVEVVQWGVDTDAFVPNGTDLRGELGLEGRAVILSARNFTPIYNQETVVSAFARVREQYPNAFLLMKSYGGDPAYLASIRSMISDLGLNEDVHILDTVPYEKMADLYRTADVMVSVPLSDAAPMSLLEAMACEVPAVVSDLASLREWVVPEQTGLLASPRDVDAVASALLLMLECPERRRRIGQNGRALVQAKASQAEHMAHMVKAYSALVDCR